MNHEQDPSQVPDPTAPAVIPDTTNSNSALNMLDEYMNSDEASCAAPTDAPSSAHTTEPLDDPTTRPVDGSADPAIAHPHPGGASPLPTVGSMALAQLPRDRQPRPSTVCQVCPAGMWSGSPVDLECYCRIKHQPSWTSSNPYERIVCDGIAIAIDIQSREQ
jgi:hypothetical protein